MAAPKGPAECPACHEQGQAVVTEHDVVWPCRAHRTVLPPLHGPHSRRRRQG